MVKSLKTKNIEIEKSTHIHTCKLGYRENLPLKGKINHCLTFAICMHVATVVPLGPNLPGGNLSKMSPGDLIILLINDTVVTELDKSFSERLLTDVLKSSWPPVESPESALFMPMITSKQLIYMYTFCMY